MANYPKFLILQIDMDKHPSQQESTHHNGEGVLFPVSCDGFYKSAGEAKPVAAYLAMKHSRLRTYVVQIVSEASI